MADYDPATRRALFAETFKDYEPEFNGRTPLDTRRRRAQILTEAKAASEARDAALFEQQQRSNPNLMNAVTARDREDRMFREGVQRGSIARQRLEFDIGKEERANQIAQKKLQLDLGREDRFLRKEQLDIDRINREEDDTLAAEEDELKLREQVTPGSSAYQRGVLDIFLRRPYVNKEYRNMALKSAGFQDPEEAFKTAADAVESGASRATVKTPGGVTATFTNEKRDLSKVQNELSAARRMFARETEPSNKTYAESLVRRLEQEAQGLGGTIGPQPEGQSQAPQAPAASANNFTDQESYMKARAAAPSGTILYFNGKPYRKQ